MGVFGDAGPMLRSHRVNNLQDRVLLIRKLIWYGEAAFNRRLPPRGGLYDPYMRQLGLAVTRGCRARNDMCELESIYRTVTMKAPDGNPNVRYTGDITDKDTFQSALRTLQYRGGDCFPEGTLFLKRRGTATVEQIEVGDDVDDGTQMVTVLKTWRRGPKAIYRFGLDNGKVLRLSRTHKTLRLHLGAPVTMAGAERAEEVRAENLRVGDALLQPLREQRSSWTTIATVEVERVEVPSYDIMTTSGRVYLPEADVITRQCDDHTALCAVLAMENGFRTRARITSNEGVSWDHIYCLAGLPKGNPTRWVALDTTLPGYRFNTHPPQAKHQDFDLDEPK